jgi:hypothetical protein
MIANSPETGVAEVARKVMLTQLIQVQAMEVLLADLSPCLANLDDVASLGALLEDIGNAYLDLAEEIAAKRAAPKHHS